MKPPINRGPDLEARVKETRWYLDNLSVTLHHGHKETRRVETLHWGWTDRNGTSCLRQTWCHQQLFSLLHFHLHSIECMINKTSHKENTQFSTAYWADRDLIWHGDKFNLPAIVIILRCASLNSMHMGHNNSL